MKRRQRCQRLLLSVSGTGSNHRATSHINLRWSHKNNNNDSKKKPEQTLRGSPFPCTLLPPPSPFRSLYFPLFSVTFYAESQQKQKLKRASWAGSSSSSSGYRDPQVDRSGALQVSEMRVGNHSWLPHVVGQVCACES